MRDVEEGISAERVGWGRGGVSKERCRLAAGLGIGLGPKTDRASHRRGLARPTLRAWLLPMCFLGLF